MLKNWVLWAAICCTTVAMSAEIDFGLKVMGKDVKHGVSLDPCSITDGYFGRAYCCKFVEKQPLKGMHSFDYRCDADESGKVYRVYFYTSVNGMCDDKLMSVCVKECERILGQKFHDNQEYGCKELLTADRRYSVQIAPIRSKFGVGSSYWLRVMVTDRSVFDAMRRRFVDTIDNNMTDLFISNEVALKQVVNISKDYCLYPEWLNFLDHPIMGILCDYRFNFNMVKLSGKEAKEYRDLFVFYFDDMIFDLAKYSSYYITARRDNVDLLEMSDAEAVRMRFYLLRNHVKDIDAVFRDRETWRKLSGADYQNMRKNYFDLPYAKWAQVECDCQAGYTLEDDRLRS